MTNDERWGLYRCVTALLGRPPTEREWSRFTETWHWLEFDNGKPQPTPEEWARWLVFMETRDETKSKTDEDA